MANATADPWLKAQWMELAGADKNAALARRNGTLVRRSDLVERGKDDG